MSLNSNDISQQDLERIELYLDRSMPDLEKNTFENELQTNDTLKQKVEEVQLLLEAIETQSLKEKLDEFHSGQDLTPIKSIAKSKTTPLFLYAIAASIVILISVGGFWVMNQNSNQKLYSKYFNPDPGLPTTMSASNNFEFYDAMVNYKQEEYSIAINKWSELHDTAPENDTLNYFIGVSYLANKNAEKAISYLETVAQNPESTFNNDAYYYLGLAYLKIDNLEFAKKYLTFSRTDNSKTLLSELND